MIRDHAGRKMNVVTPSQFGFFERWLLIIVRKKMDLYEKERWKLQY
jgi:hypothetical protein